MPAAEPSGRKSSHIVVLGPMGAGKTTLARGLARVLHRQFFDSDQSIRERTGRIGREIARTDGVEELHRLEGEALFDALASPIPVVVAAAASVIEDPAVRAALEDTYRVWVTADPQILAERSTRGRHRRPVAPSENLEHRDPLFRHAADVIVDTGVLSEDESVRRVLSAIRGE